MMQIISKIKDDSLFIGWVMVFGKSICSKSISTNWFTRNRFPLFLVFQKKIFERKIKLTFWPISTTLVKISREDRSILTTSGKQRYLESRDVHRNCPRSNSLVISYNRLRPPYISPPILFIAQIIRRRVILYIYHYDSVTWGRNN